MRASIIDVHSHPLFLELIDALGKESGDMPMPPWSAEQHIETMDKNGIDVCVLSTPGVTEKLVGAKASSVARAISEQLVKAIS